MWLAFQEARDLEARKEEMRAQDQRRMDLMAQKQEAYQVAERFSIARTTARSSCGSAKTPEI